MLTCLRIIGSLWLIFATPVSEYFLLVYTICGLTDVLDGVLARALKIESALGAKLDSTADLLYYTVMLVRILPQLWSRLPVWIWYAAAAVVAVRIAAYLTAAYKFRCFASLHTYLNKLTGFMLFGLPYMLFTAYLTHYSIGVCVVAALSSLEELLIHLFAKQYSTANKSIFLLRSGIQKMS